MKATIRIRREAKRIIEWAEVIRSGPIGNIIPEGLAHIINHANNIIEMSKELEK